MWIRDARYTLRQLRRSPTSSLTVMCTIAVAIAANALVFTVLQAASFRKLPYKNDERLLVAAPLAPGVILQWRSRSTSFASMSAFLVWDFDVLGVERPERVSAAVVTADFFDTLSATPQVGRVFAAADWRTGSLVAVASDAYARRHFGAAASALRQTLSINGRRYELVGVMRKAVRFPAVVDLWIPARQQAPEYPLDPEAPVTTNFGSHYLGAVGRLAAGVTREAAQAEQRTIFRRLVSEHSTQMVAEDVEVNVVPIRQWLVGELSGQVLILLGVVAVVLLIACTNVANVLLVRVVARSREFATRTALGATSLATNGKRQCRHNCRVRGVSGFTGLNF